MQLMIQYNYRDVSKPQGWVNIFRNATTILSGKKVNINRNASMQWKYPYSKN